MTLVVVDINVYIYFTGNIIIFAHECISLWSWSHANSQIYPTVRETRGISYITLSYPTLMCHLLLLTLHYSSPLTLLTYLSKETFKTFLTITFIISLHKAVSSKRITAMFADETICMVGLVLVVQLLFFRLNLTTTMSTTACRAGTTL
jgi:hypothetical protein